MRMRLSYILGAFVLWGALASYAKEPEHDGKKLSFWIKEFRQPGNPETRLQAQKAIRQIGTNALPFLLDEMMDLGDAWRSDLTNFVNSPNSWDRLMNVRAGVEALGGVAEPAFQTWANLIRSNSLYADVAAYALTQIDPQQAAPILSEQIQKNTNNFTRFAAINNLFYVGTNAVVAVPSLMSCLDEKGDSQEAWQFRRLAVGALGNMKQCSDTVVPRLAEVLRADESWPVRAKAAKTLATFTNAALPALPTLRLAATNDANERVRKAAATAIKTIESATK